MQAKENNKSKSTDPERNGPPHSNSNGAAVDGTANQVPGVGQGAGGPGDGQGPGLGAGQGQPQSKQPPANTDGSTPSDEDESAAIQNPQDSGNQTHDDTPFIHPEPPTNTPQNQTDDSAASTDPTEPASQPQNINQLPSESSPTNNPDQSTTPIHQPSTQTNETQTESLPSKEEEGLIQNNGLFEINHSLCNNKILQIDLTAAAGNINRLSFVKVDYDPLTGVSIDGQKANDSEAFRELIQDNLVDPNGSSIYIGGNTERTILWNLNCVDSGHYAPVMITKSGEILTLGSAADGREHVLISGGNTFNFEDLMSYQNADWDYNDLTVRLTEI